MKKEPLNPELKYVIPLIEKELKFIELKYPNQKHNLDKWLNIIQEELTESIVNYNIKKSDAAYSDLISVIAASVLAFNRR